MATTEGLSPTQRQLHEMAKALTQLQLADARQLCLNVGLQQTPEAIATIAHAMATNYLAEATRD